MRPVKQLYRRGRDDKKPPHLWGDCWRACLASILELPVRDLPNIHVPDGNSSDDDEWTRRWNEYLWQRFRLQVIFVEPIDWDDWPDGYPGVGTFEIKEGATNHCAVVWGGSREVAHDPWSGEGLPLGELLEVGVLVFGGCR